MGSHELPLGENHPVKTVGHHIERKKFGGLLKCSSEGQECWGRESEDHTSFSKQDF